MAYILNLTAEDIATIDFVSSGYDWANALSCYEEGDNVLTESDAWDLKEAFESDTEGGHSLFPMLARDSELYEKLLRLLDSIV